MQDNEWNWEDPQIPWLGLVSQCKLWCLEVGKYADQPYASKSRVTGTFKEL